MKTLIQYKLVLSSLITAACLAWCAGCSKSETPSNNALSGEKPAGESTLQKAADQVKGAAAAVAAQAQPIIDKAKSLVSEQKYTEALDSLKQLSNLKLTPEQQKIVDGLKEQVQAALSKAGVTNAASAASAVGNLLKK